MIVGFTGTRQGMTNYQQSQVIGHLLFREEGDLEPGDLEVHHGDCLGADAEFHQIAREIGFHIVGHPPDNDKARAFCDFDEVMEPKPYIVRNHDIVDACDVLIACPSGPEKLRSGTWATIRYAKKIGKQVIIIYPNEVT